MLMEVTEYTEDAENKFNSFKEIYMPAINIFLELLDKVYNSVQAISDDTDEKWNTLNDMQILFGLLYESNIKNKILVTNEKMIKRVCVESGIGDNVITLDEYLKLIGLS
jgi:hypothetical protein